MATRWWTLSPPADAYIINTCSVTAVSDKKSRQMIRRAKSRNPQAVVAPAGAMCRPTPRRLRSWASTSSAAPATGWRFLTLLEQAAEDHRARVAVDEAPAPPTFEVLPAGAWRRTRAMLKVEDGCVNFCTYCIIPYARGPVRSLPLEEAVRQTGSCGGRATGRWSLPASRSPLGDRISRTAAASSICWRRCRRRRGDAPAAGRLEPRTVTEDFCRRAARLPNLCPQFHLSMQSGCDATLRRMNRRYDTARFLRSVTLLRQYFPRPAITTDLICGFPGETEEEFPRRWPSCAAATLPRCTSSPTPSAPAPGRRRWSRSPARWRSVPPVRRRWRRAAPCLSAGA